MERPFSGGNKPAGHLEPIERVRFRIAVGVLIIFGSLMLIPLLAIILDFGFLKNVNMADGIGN